MVVNGNGADMSGEAKARQADALMKDWLEDPDTPKWAHGLIQSMTPTDGALMSTRDLFHIGKDIELCLMIAGGDPETQERWAGNTDCPDWFREAIVAYSFAETQLAANRIIVDMDFFKRQTEAMVRGSGSE